MDLAKAKSILQRKEGSTSVYEHLTEVILKLLTEQPDNAVAAFEQLSAQVKGASFPDFGTGGRGTGAAGAAAFSEARAKLLAAQAALFKPLAPENEGDEAPGPGEPVQDLTEEANFLEWAGFSLGRTETFRLHLSLKQLASKQPVKNLRFWGRLFGRKGDYFVAEGVMDAGEEEGDEDKDALGNVIQKTGDGPNKFTYFVCSGVGAPWVKLPRVTPHQLIAARQLRRYLTGELSAPVPGHPPFPGKEENLLRATIALISADTAIAPSGVFRAVEGDETGAIEPNTDEFDAPDLSTADGWVHTGLQINALGRTRPNPPKTDESGEPVPDENAPEPSAPLKPIGEDAPVDEAAEEGGGAWDVKACFTAGLSEGEAGAGPFVARSLRWPGAVAVGIGKKSTSVYCGWGLPTATARYQPALPPALPAEFNFAEEATRVAEKKDVTEAPPEPAAEGEEGAE